MKIKDKKQHSKTWYYRNKTRAKQNNKKWKDIHPNYNQEYYKKNKNDIDKKGKDHYKKNRQKILERCKKYNKKNKDKLQLISRRWQRQKRKTDKEFNITSRLRNMFNAILRKYIKTNKIAASKKYKINYQAIINHLMPFPKDISKYHIDHIKPLCSFTFIDKNNSINLNEIQKAFVPENHQWLLASKNQSKGGRIVNNG